MKKQWIGLLACLALSQYLGQLQAASFDCGKARTTFEHIICAQADPADQVGLVEFQRQELIKLDDELNALYREALAQHFDPTLLRREQRAWMKARDRCVRDKEGCAILSLYADRIDNLRYDLAHPPKTPEGQKNARLLSMGSPPGDNFTFDRHGSNNGQGFGLCEALVRWFNHTTPKGEMACGARIVRTMPGIEEPAWREIDIGQHEALFLAVLRDENRWEPEEKVQKYFAGARARGDKLWMVKEQVFHSDPAKGKPQTVLWHQIPEAELGCLVNAGHTLIATDDLSGVDKAMQNNVGLGASYGDMLLYFKGRPNFISAHTTSGSVYGPRTICSITNFKPEGSKK